MFVPMQQIFSRNGRDCTEINSLVVAELQDWSSKKSSQCCQADMGRAGNALGCPLLSSFLKRSCSVELLGKADEL